MAIFKKFTIESTSISQKYRELIEPGAASVLYCWYCAKFHRSSAEQYGAAEEEIQEAYILPDTLPAGVHILKEILMIRINSLISFSRSEKIWKNIQAENKLIR